MDSRKSKKQTMKPKKRKEKKYKSGRFMRRKSLRSFGDFMGRLLKTLGTLAHFREGRPPDVEEDDGGFGQSDTGGFKDEGPGKKISIVSSHGLVKERLSGCYGDKTPGVLGLKNHGNTCFMNAVVQCLSNTDLLAEYLGLERYRTDVCQRKVNNASADQELQPTRGEVTEQLASLVRALWTMEYTPQLSVEFKSTVAKYASQFRGNSQHDALEFLLWLLDRVHEDANNTSSSNTKAKVKGSNPLDTSSSPRSASAHQPKSRHSFVQEHFQAQYRSSLTCPHCLKQSNTFDPFSCISLPIPLRQTRPLCVTLVFSTKGQRYLRVGLAIPLFGSMSTLRAMVAEEGSISPEMVILSELYPTGFQRSFSDDDDLTSVSDTDVVYAFQAPPLYTRGGSSSNSGFHHSLPSSPYNSKGPDGHRLQSLGTVSSEYLNHGVSSKVLLLICNTAGSGQQAVRFGPPFLMWEDRGISWDQLRQSILSKLYYLMVNGPQVQNVGQVFKIRVVGSSAAYSYLSSQDSRPLYHPAFDRALKLCGPGGPPHVKVVIEWEPTMKERLFGNIQEEVVKDAESVRNQQQQHMQQHTCTLDQCIQLYTKEEQLAPDDAWKCPHCKKLQQGMVKMSLWTLPDILILHLKRFRQVGEKRNKLSTLVHFPLTTLDMAPHVVKRSQSMKSLNPAAWTQSSSSHPSELSLPHDYLYDLYAVCNHHGGMHGGHYTAYCRNSVDGQWYSYDDSSVDLVPEEEVCTRGAYILFYQRRNIIPPWSANFSPRGSICSSMSDHWLIRLTGDSERGSVVSRSSTACPSLQPESLDVLVNEPKEDRDAEENRPFVRGQKVRSVSMRAPTKTKDTLSKVLPVRWSLGSKERRKPESVPARVQDPDPAELVQYLESGRRPRCTKDSIVTLMNEPKAEPAVTQPHGKGRSLSIGSVNPVANGGSQQRLESGQVPEGQSRPSDKGGSTRRSKGAHRVDEGLPVVTASLSSSSLNRKKQRLPNTGVQTSNSSPTIHYEIQRRHGDSPVGESDRASKLKSHEGLLSFFKGNFMKRDKEQRRPSDLGREENVELSKAVPSRVSNGTVGNKNERRNVSGHPRTELVNGQLGQTTLDIKRSQSSISLPTKTEAAMRRTGSLHRNGKTAGPARSLITDKPSHGTLQRTRYSTTSLGRKRVVPESSF